MSFSEEVKNKFAEVGNTANIPKLEEGTFLAVCEQGGVRVDNLGSSPILPWDVFDVVEQLLKEENGMALRGDAENCRLGEEGLPLNSVEGRVASVVYCKREGDAVFPRITPIACILIWAEVCHHHPGQLGVRLNLKI